MGKRLLHVGVAKTELQGAVSGPRHPQHWDHHGHQCCQRNQANQVLAFPGKEGDDDRCQGWEKDNEA